MRHRLAFFAFFCLCALIAAGLIVLRKADRFLYNYWTARVTPDVTMQRNLVLLGDSHLDRGTWPLLNDNFRVVNLGVGGSTVEDLYERVSSVELKGDCFLIHVGVNDLRAGRDAREVAGILAKVVKRLKATADPERIVLSAVFPLDESSPTAARAGNKAIELLNGLIANIATEEGCRFFSHFDSPDAILPYLSDGLHLTTEGYDQFEAALLRFLEK